MSWKVGDRIKLKRACALVCRYREKPAGSAFFADAYQRLTLDAGTILEVCHAKTRWDKTQAVMPSFWVVGMNRPTFVERPKIDSHGRVLYTETVQVDNPNALWPDGSAKPNYQRTAGRLQIETNPSGGQHFGCIVLDPRFFEKVSE